jgi:sialate O-acetylesterase
MRASRLFSASSSSIPAIGARYGWLVGMLFSGLISCARADVSISPLFSDHAVLQRSDKVPVWGNAAPGESVTVTVGGATGTATAGSGGKWKAFLDLRPLGQAPLQLVAKGSATQVVSEDVIVGEVWLCSGQSNMEFSLRSAINASQEIASSANPLLRQFHVENKPSPTPVDDLKGHWIVASPETAADFTAVGYFFGKKLQKGLHVPIGLINSSLGATPVETWTSLEGFNADEALKAGAAKSQDQFNSFKKYVTDYQAWETQSHREDHPTSNLAPFASSTVPAQGWQSISLPSTTDPLPAGAVWIRRTIQVPVGKAGFGTNVNVALGDLTKTAQIQVYWNGIKVGQSQVGAGSNSNVDFSSDVIHEGDNALAIRVFNASGPSGIAPGSLPLHAGPVPLAGDWQMKVEQELPPLSGPDKASLPQLPATSPDARVTAAFCYNGMINPLIPCAIRGVVWYQGEGNAGRAFQYQTAFSLLIKDWRTRWGEGDFPFYFCQLANYQDRPRTPQPSDSCWAELREAQSKTLSVPNTQEAVLIDLGEEASIHPRDKQDVGERLARIALAKTYGKKTPYAGPFYSSMSVEGAKIRLHFEHADGDLVARTLPTTYQPSSLDPKTVPLVRDSPDSQLEGFAICGPDHQWKWAKASIDNGTVVVWNDGISDPVAVRYAWSDNPVCNLYNGAGLPAAPFRTDDFPILTRDARF